MYASEVEGQTLTLAVSGMLWNRSLIMVDRETNSLWSHLLGKAMRGKLEGKKLERLPATMTDWKTWREMRPDTTVIKLSRTSQNFRRAVYRNPEQYVIGISEGENARAWSYDQLLKKPLVHDLFDKTPVLILFVPESSTAFVFDRRVGGRTVTLKLQKNDSEVLELVDATTGARWNRQTGDSVTGDEDLKPVAGIVSFLEAWKVFHPKSTYFVVP